VEDTVSIEMAMERRALIAAGRGRRSGDATGGAPHARGLPHAAAPAHPGPREVRRTGTDVRDATS